MNEDQNQQEEQAAVDPADLVQRAEAAAERIEKATAAFDAQNRRAEKLAVEKTLGGKTEKTAPPREESATEYANRMLRGGSSEGNKE